MKVRIIASMISFVLLFSFTLPLFVDATIESENDGIVEEYIPEINLGVDLSNVDVSSFDFENFQKEYDFLVNDPVFLQLEAEVSKPRVEYITEKNPFTGELIVKEEILPAIVVGALRILVSKVGRKAADRAWAVARPYVQKALNSPRQYILEAGKGGMIIQVRSKATGKRVFALDYHYIDGKGPILHYHSPPNVNDHKYFW
ncbi:hypothetical protein [Bacillus thuringiensis]|uniref:Uncharacterized protein n=1 Tax=Bacillus thuringiensis serovar andalousiensis TaxID=257985 RepID=A0A6H0TP39_BACTU|nr:hypothetical protein [Bacillus thuringiensis]QIW22199.1 hypothetical protein EVG22_29390 [Bacillus thuringiensis serovar andalousiensis]